MKQILNKEKEEYLNYINKYYKYNKINKKLQIYKLNKSEYAKLQLLSNKEIKSLFELAKLTLNFLKDYKINYWLSGGSLSGAVQNNKLLPWDNDIDLAIPCNKLNKTRIIEIIKRNGIKRNNYYIFSKYNIKFRFLKNDKQKIKVNYYNDKKNKIFIDLLLFFKKNNKYKYKSSSYNSIDIYPMKKIKLNNLYFKSVKNPISYLNNTYIYWKHLGKTTNKNKYFIMH